MTDDRKKIKKLVIRAKDGGRRGPPGPQGEDGLSAFELAIDEGFEGTLEEWLESLRGPRGRAGAKGARGAKGDRGYQGASGGAGPPGPAGPEPVPLPSTLTRDASGSVETVTVQGKPTMTISRNPDGTVASIASSERTVSVLRDGSGAIEGTDVTEL